VRLTARRVCEDWRNHPKSPFSLKDLTHRGEIRTMEQYASSSAGLGRARLGRTATRFDRPSYQRWVRLTMAMTTCCAGLVAGLADVILNAQSASAISVIATQGVDTPAASNATPVCGAGDLARSVNDGGASAPTNAVSRIVGGSWSVQDFYASNSGLYVNTGTEILGYSLSGSLLWQVSTTVPNGLFSWNTMPQYRVFSGATVGPNGTLYVNDYPAGIAAIDPITDTVLWTMNVKAADVYPWWNGSTFELFVPTSQVQNGGILVSTSGSQIGTVTFPVAGGGVYEVSETPSGDDLVTENNYVEVYSPSGTLINYFGGSGHENQAGLQLQGFWEEGGAIDTGNQILVLDGGGSIDAFSTDGEFEGSTNLGGFNPSQVPQAYLVNGNVYFVGGGNWDNTQEIDVVSLSAIEEWLSQPQAPSDVLGWGAGIEFGSPSALVAGNYFPYGSTPTAFAYFDPWYSQIASHLEITYSVASLADEVNGDWPAAQTIPLGSVSDLQDVQLNLPTGVPGSYQINVNLYDTSSGTANLIGSTCATYGVGAPGDRLNMSTLPGSPGWGGASDVRGVVLNAELGLDGFRGSSVSWNQLLPNCNVASPTAQTCGPEGLDYSNFPQYYFQAAYLANEYHISYWIQVDNETCGNPEPIGCVLVQDGYWGPDVQALVAYYANPNNCSSTATDSECAPVTAWEAWNEANNTGFGDPATYVNEVLRPFYEAVKAAEPNGTVVGGSSLGVANSWWQGVIQAGGIDYMDAAGVHPYTSYDDTWEEDGTIPAIRQLELSFSAACAQDASAPCHAPGSLPLWFTEVGWWSNSPAAFYEQANAVARAMIWQKVLGVPVWNYFYDEGGWDLDWGLLQVGGPGGEFVKPSALAAMETANQLSGRPYLGMPIDSTSGLTSGQAPVIPQTYEALFGPTPGGDHNLAAIWTDGLATTASVTITSPSEGQVPITVTDQYGASHSFTLDSGVPSPLYLSSSVVWVLYPATDRLIVGAPVSYGPDLALGAQTSASSTGGGSLANPVDGNPTGYNYWESAGGDSQPWFQIELPTTATIDRVVVVTASEGSVEPELRDYQIDVEDSQGNWVEVASVSGEYYEHAEEIDFSPIQAQAVKVQIEEVNDAGEAGGAVPWYLSPDAVVPALIRQVEVYGGSADQGQLQGSQLPGPPLNSPEVSLVQLVENSGPTPTSSTTTSTTQASSVSTNTTTTALGLGGSAQGGSSTSSTSTTISTMTTTTVPRSQGSPAGSGTGTFVGTGGVSASGVSSGSQPDSFVTTTTTSPNNPEGKGALKSVIRNSPAPTPDILTAGTGGLSTTSVLWQSKTIAYVTVANINTKVSYHVIIGASSVPMLFIGVR